jgi:hypothetical protein
MARLIALALLASCTRPLLPAVAPSEKPEWRTLRAEHRVALDAAGEKRSLRGAIAVEQPDRFRLRALGPGGITLFDLRVVGASVKVLQAIRDPSKSVLGEIIESLAGDLRAAFFLVGRRENNSMVVEDTERTVTLSHFVRVAGKAVASRIDIVNRAHHYTVAVDASNFEIDSPLDPALFSD